jgi:hypothetical protein
MLHANTGITHARWPGTIFWGRANPVPAFCPSKKFRPCLSDSSKNSFCRVPNYSPDSKKKATWKPRHIGLISMFFAARIPPKQVCQEIQPALMTQRRYPPTHLRIIAAMTENYASKRERWQKLLDALPESLRGHISLRNVEAVSALSPQAQGTLAQAIQAGLKRLPRAIELLGKAPELTVPELLEKVSAGQEPAEIAIVPDADTQRRLADLIQFCYPDMPRVSAEALSQAEALSGILQIVSAHESVFASPHLNSDFVLVIFHACLKQALERLDGKLAENPAFQQAISQNNLTTHSTEVSNA